MTKSSIWVLLTEQVELHWGNGKVDDVFFVAGYNLEGSVVSQVCTLNTSMSPLSLPLPLNL